MRVKVLKGSLALFDWEFYVGPWVGRLVLSRHGWFAWREGDGWITQKLRKVWSGWHRWETD